MIPVVLSQSLWMFSVWLVFTSNLNSQTTWLKVKRIVNFSVKERETTSSKSLDGVISIVYWTVRLVPGRTCLACLALKRRKFLLLFGAAL